MTIEEKVRGLCRVLLAAQNDEGALRIMPRLSEAFDELREQAWPHGRWKRLRSIISYARQSIARELLNEVLSDLNEGCKEAISAGSRIVPIGSAS